MKSRYKNLIPLLLIMMTSSGCYYDILGRVPEYQIVKDKDGKAVLKCDMSRLVRGGGADRFWKENNLPKGTTEFVCQNGKAYLPGQVPSGEYYILKSKE